jgi:hypothetical protein
LQDYGFRIYNPALARFLSVDPLSPKYPELTPYQFASNTPIWAIDLDGLEAYIRSVTQYYGTDENGNRVVLENVRESESYILCGTGILTEYTAPDGTKSQYWTSDVIIPYVPTFGDLCIMSINAVSDATSATGDLIENTLIAADGYVNNLGGNYWTDNSNQWVQAGSMGGKASYGIGPFTVQVEGGIYSTNEDNAGVYFQLSLLTPDIKVGIDGNGFTNLETTVFNPPAANAFIQAHTANTFTQNGFYTSTSTQNEINVQAGPVGLSGKNSTSSDGKKGTTVGLTVGTGSTGLKGGAANKHTFGFNSGLIGTIGNH